MTVKSLSRRNFIQASAAISGGFVLGFYMPQAIAAKIDSKPWTSPPQGVEVNAWLAIGADGTITIRVPHTEMGQGGLTSVALLIAEELHVEWDKVRAVFADPNRHLRNNNEYKIMSTHGSIGGATAPSFDASRCVRQGATQASRCSNLGRSAFCHRSSAWRTDCRQSQSNLR